MVSSKYIRLMIIYYREDSASNKKGDFIQVKKGGLLWNLDSLVARAVLHVCTIILR